MQNSSVGTPDPPNDEDDVRPGRRRHPLRSRKAVINDDDDDTKRSENVDIGKYYECWRTF